MSLKTIFPDDTTYSQITSATWNNISIGFPEIDYANTFDNSNDASHTNIQTIPISATVLNDNLAVVSIYSHDSNIEPIVYATTFPFLSSSPLPAGSFNPNAPTKLGTTFGVILTASNLYTFRPCTFTWFIDTSGYVYYTPCYNSMTGSTPTITNNWSGTWATGYIYIPVCNSTGNMTLQNSFSIGGITPEMKSFVYSIK